MIQINNLKKSFGSQIVLNDLDFTIERGKITYIVGPNGCGKTTFIKIILGLVKVDNGSVTINGEKLNGDCEYRKNIGYIPQDPSFPDNLRVSEIFKMIKDLRYPNSVSDTELIDKFQLEKEMDKRLKNLSGGTKQKVSAALAFLFNPAILILDEPTAGLDPVASSLLKDKIKKEKDGGKTIILTSHILSELEELAENIVFFLEGKVKFNGNSSQLIDDTGQPNLERAMAVLMNG